MNQNAVDLLDDAAAAYLGVNRTDARCLDVIDRRERITAGELATEVGLTTGAITTALDRLEGKGYVRRLRDEHDRRKVLVELTDEARRRSWEVFGPMVEQAGAQFKRYSEAQLKLLREFMETGRQIMLDHAKRVHEMLQQAGGAPAAAEQDQA
jgi:DNA-binding MarR family transcriptional regulator